MQQTPFGRLAFSNHFANMSRAQREIKRPAYSFITLRKWNPSTGSEESGFSDNILSHYPQFYVSSVLFCRLCNPPTPSVKWTLSRRAGTAAEVPTRLSHFVVAAKPRRARRLPDLCSGHETAALATLALEGAHRQMKGICRH